MCNMPYSAAMVDARFLVGGHIYRSSICRLMLGFPEGRHARFCAAQVGIALRRVASGIRAAVEDAIGSAGLSARLRAHVREAQLHSVEQLASVAGLNASLVAIVLL